MKKKRFYLILCILISQVSFSQKTDDKDLEAIQKSIFTDFRIPIRENINESDLRQDGWKTDAGAYTFRCRDRKRIRMTLWYLDSGPKKVIGSEFVNITAAIDKCQKGDLKYREYHDKEAY
ncbi:hypothetical protein [Ochrovirga pacifica]|uniref:hypothetical protein n=1 Tax=Ochrovirga pacifica TaxID=1042376 RepID=UPI001111EB17|nr:hypothetical protein [Ochrovirga pacifica]